MPGYDGSIRIATQIDTKGFKQGAKEIEGGVNQLQGSIKGVGTALGIAFGVAVVKDFTGDVIEATAELQAMDSQFNQVFKGSEGEAALEAINAQADELGIHADRLTGSFNKFGGQVKGAGMDAAQALEATEKATGLAADAAAFYDISLEEASSMLASFMKGNFEAGDAIGVFTNAKQMDARSNEMYGKSWADLNEAEKQWLLLDTVGKTYEMNGAAGQAAREQGNWANVTANLKATWDEFLASVGSPILAGAIAVVQSMAEGISSLIGAMKENPELFTLLGIGLATLTSAIIAYNIAQSASAIITGISTAATAAFGAVIGFLTSPITLVVLAIGALIAIGYLLIQHWDEVKAFAQSTWEAIKAAWEAAGTWFNESVVIPIQTFFTGLWNGISGAALSVWNTITGIWGAVAKWFNQHVIEPLKNGFKEGINFLIGLAEGFANSFINGINAIIRALNTISFDIPDWVPKIGGKSFGINIPTVKTISIPRLATGAVIPPNQEFLAILGDQKRGVNIETPLETMITAFDASFDRAFERMGSGDTKVSIEFKGDLAHLARVLEPAIQAEKRRRGPRLIL